MAQPAWRLTNAQNFTALISSMKKDWEESGGKIIKHNSIEYVQASQDYVLLGRGHTDDDAKRINTDSYCKGKICLYPEYKGGGSKAFLIEKIEIEGTMVQAGKSTKQTGNRSELQGVVRDALAATKTGWKQNALGDPTFVWR